MILPDQDSTTSSGHPDPDKLAAFGRGRLDDEAADVIAEHLGACAECLAAVEAAGEDTLARVVRGAIATGPPEEPGPRRPAAPFEILEVLGEGGMGVVFKARQPELGRIVALKQIRPDALAGDDGLARFRREAGAAARLRHPNIVAIFDIGRLDGVPYYAMELVEGGTLADRLEAGPLAWAEAARLVEALARAVAHAHDAGVIHRDLKPANVLLAPDLATPKIGDFGLAKRDDDGTRTKTGAILGTPNYMAPEQASGDSARVGPAADVYALGAILYEALAGRPPFSADSTLETLEQVRTAEPVPPRRVRRGVPRDLETIALKCLEKAPSRRYSSALALADDLRRYLDGEPIRARPASAPERLAKWAWRRPWRAATVALALAATAVLLAVTLAHNARLRVEVARTGEKAAEARDQRNRADAQYRSARAAIRKMLDRLDESRREGIAVPADLERRLLEDALSFYDGALRGAETDAPSATIDRAESLVGASSVQWTMGRLGDAEGSLRRALGLVDGLGPDRGDDPRALAVQVDARNKLGLILDAAGRRDEAIAMLESAIERAERLCRVDPLPFRKDDLARGHHSLGTTLILAGRPAEAERHFLRAVETRLASFDGHPNRHDAEGRLAESLINLAYLHAQAHQEARADREYAEAASWLKSAAIGLAERHRVTASFGDLYLNWGTLALHQGQLATAIERFEAGDRALDDALSRMPDWPRGRQALQNLRKVLAFALEKAGRFGDAARALERALPLTEGPERLAVRLVMASHFARGGAPDRAMEEAVALASATPPPPGGDLYNLACIAALAAASAEATGPRDRAEAHADRAVAWLGRARAAGAFRSPELRAGLDDDSDLAILRPRSDFRSLRQDAAFPADPFAPRR